MAWAYHVYIVNPDDEEIYVEHIFYGETKQDCTHVRDEHLGSCAYYKTAEDEGRTDDKWEEIRASERPMVILTRDDDDAFDIGGGG